MKIKFWDKIFIWARRSLRKMDRPPPNLERPDENTWARKLCLQSKKFLACFISNDKIIIFEVQNKKISPKKNLFTKRNDLGE